MLGRPTYLFCTSFFPSHHSCYYRSYELGDSSSIRAYLYLMTVDISRILLRTKTMPASVIERQPSLARTGIRGYGCSTFMRHYVIPAGFRSLSIPKILSLHHTSMSSASPSSAKPE